MPRHSSTSSSDDPASRPVRVADALAGLLAVLLGLVVLDLAFRTRVPTLSLNSRTLAGHAERAARIREAGEVPTVLVLGNSSSRTAVDAGRLSQALARLGTPAVVEHQPSDSSNARDWYYQLKNMFVARGAVPDWVVLPDGTASPLTRVEAGTEDLLFTMLAWGDLPEYFALSGIRGFEERAAVVFSKASALYCFRGRVQKRVLGTLVPGYAEVREALAGEVAREGEGEGAPGTDPTWIRRLATLAGAHGVGVAVVPLPTSALGGRLPEPERVLAASLGLEIWELAPDGPWPEDEVPDGLHLGEEARARFTDLLAGPLHEALARGARAPVAGTGG